MSNITKPTFGASPFALLIMTVSIFLFGLQAHGIWVGIVLTVTFLILVLILNFVSIVKLESLKWSTYFRLALYIIIMIGIGISKAEVCDQTGVCESVL